MVNSECTRNDDEILTVTDDDKKIGWTSLSWEDFEQFSRDKNSLFRTDTVSGVPWSRLIDKDMVRESISKINNGKAAGPPGVMSEMVAKDSRRGSC